jgi:lysyl-tRNA synthetase class II
MNINDNFINNDTAKKNDYEYGKFDEKLVISDMRIIFEFTHESYQFYFKTIVNSQIVICPRSQLDFINTFKNIVVGSYTNKKGKSSVNLYDRLKIGSEITSG